MKNISKFVRAYLECALWTSTDETDEQGGNPLDENYDISDIDDKSIEQAIQDCESFQDFNAKLLDENGEDSEMNGHNFWLSRNGHGCGFFDACNDVGNKLQAAAKVYGEVNVYVGDDGKVYFS